MRPQSGETGPTIATTGHGSAPTTITTTTPERGSHFWRDHPLARPPPWWVTLARPLTPAPARQRRPWPGKLPAPEQHLVTEPRAQVRPSSPPTHRLDFGGFGLTQVSAPPASTYSRASGRNRPDRQGADVSSDLHRASRRLRRPRHHDGLRPGPNRVPDRRVQDTPDA